MDLKILTEKGWKDALAKFKLKDNGLQRALADHEKLDDADFEKQSKSLAHLAQLIAGMKKLKEVAGNRDAEKHLASMSAAAAACLTQAQSAKTKAAAEAAASEKAKNKGGKSVEDDDTEEEAGDYAAKLLAALQKLRSSKDLIFEFVVCDAKPFCGLGLAKRISSQHKAELTKITGGGTRFLPIGTCVFNEGKFEFRMEKPVQGLAKRIQDSIKNFTGKKFPIKAGLEIEAEGAGQGPEASAAQPTGSQAKAAPSDAPKPRGPVTLDQAPQHWDGTREMIDGVIKKLKQAVLAEFDGAGQDLTAELDKTMSMLDVILDKLDRRLANSLSKANAAKDPTARQAELKNSKVILAEYINYIKSEKLIAHIDDNPLGIPTNLKQTLAERLTHVAQAIG